MSAYSWEDAWIKANPDDPNPHSHHTDGPIDEDASAAGFSRAPRPRY